MSDITDALTQLKTVMATVDPSPQPTLAGVWVYPADHASITFDDLPVCVVAQVVNQDREWGFATYGRGKHRWEAEILLFLERGPLTDDPQSAQAEQKQDPWPQAVAAALMANLTLGGTVRAIGDDEKLFSYRVGHIHWWSDVYWGIRFVLPVLQHPVQARGA
jgi:hypothetical protein